MIFELSSFGDSKYFLCAFIVGVFLGIVYDVFRLVRIVLPKNDALIFFEDILFCLFAAISFLLLAFNVGSGRIRAYAAISTLVGFSLYYSTIGKLVYKVNGIIISFIKGTIKRILSLIKRPFELAFERAYRIHQKRRLAKKRKKVIKRAIKEIKKGFGTEETI